jgi:hypothetical protein
MPRSTEMLGEQRMDVQELERMILIRPLQWYGGAVRWWRNGRRERPCDGRQRWTSRDRGGC